MAVPNSESGNSKKYLDENELEAIFKAAKTTNYPKRDYALCKLSFRHGLRCSEALALTWNDVDFNNARLHIHRLKNGISISHPLIGEELRYLKALQREGKKPYLFYSRKGQQLTSRAVRHLISNIGKLVGMPKLHHHQFRHSCGFHMAMKGIDTITIKDWLGHKDVTNTMIYVNLAGKRFDTLKEW